MRFYAAILMLVMSLALGGCINSNSDSGTDPVSQGLSYYYDEFADVAIPKEMTAKSRDTFITYSSDGVKLGTQLMSGRVELGSLVSAMQSHMARDGWTLRSIFRSSRSILIFERPDRMCSMYISDGMIDTEMLIFVSPKPQPGAIQSAVPASVSPEPLNPTDPPLSGSGSSTTGATSNGNVTVYPAK